MYVSVVRFVVPLCGRVSKGLSCGTELAPQFDLAFGTVFVGYDTMPFASVRVAMPIRGRVSQGLALPAYGVRCRKHSDTCLCL